MFSAIKIIAIAAIWFKKIAYLAKHARRSLPNCMFSLVFQNNTSRLAHFINFANLALPYSKFSKGAKTSLAENTHSVNAQNHDSKKCTFN